jgi:alpha-galactosidase
MGPSAPYTGDHVELSDGGNDFASTYGIGAIPSTKFTWPADTTNPTDKLPPGGFVLTPEKETLWRKWIGLYRANMLAKGKYLGGLYDIGFDRPEGHAIAKGGVLTTPSSPTNGTGRSRCAASATGRYRTDRQLHRRPARHRDARPSTIPAVFEHFLLVVPRPPAEARMNGMISSRAWLAQRTSSLSCCGASGAHFPVCRRSTAFRTHWSIACGR